MDDTGKKIDGRSNLSSLLEERISLFDKTGAENRSDSNIPFPVLAGWLILSSGCDDSAKLLAGDKQFLADLQIEPEHWKLLTESWKAVKDIKVSDLSRLPDEEVFKIMFGTWQQISQGIDAHVGNDCPKGPQTIKIASLR